MNEALIRANIEEIIGGTWFDYEISTNDVEMTTRENGDVYEEKAGGEDVSEAIRIVKLLRTALEMEVDCVDVAWETIDEWVSISFSDETIQKIESYNV